MDDLELARTAQRAGMRAIVLKAHEGSTAERAWLVGRQIVGLEVLGGVVLNRFVGGLNPHAVEVCFGLGGRVVWMPTLHAENHIRYYGRPGFSEQASRLDEGRVLQPVAVLDEAGRLLPEAGEVLEVVAAHDGVLSNGHLSAQETAILFTEARRLGVRRLVVAHPELPLMGYSLEFQLEMAQMGAYIERCYLPHLPGWGGFPLERTAREIQAIGPERCILSTDLGQLENPPPPKGLGTFCRGLHQAGLCEAAIHAMVRANPASLLGLDTLE